MRVCACVCMCVRVRARVCVCVRVYQVSVKACLLCASRHQQLTWRDPSPVRSIYRMESVAAMMRAIGAAFPSNGLSHPNHLETCGHKIYAHFPVARRCTDVDQCLVASARLRGDGVVGDQVPRHAANPPQRMSKEHAIGAWCVVRGVGGGWGNRDAMSSGGGGAALPSLLLCSVLFCLCQW